MQLEGYSFDFLSREGKADETGTSPGIDHRRKGAVIMALAVADAVQGAIEGGERQDDEIRHDFRRGFGRAIGSKAGRQQWLIVVVETEAQGRTVDKNRQRDRGASLPRRRQDRPRIGFGADRPIAGDDTGRKPGEQRRRKSGRRFGRVLTDANIDRIAPCERGGSEIRLQVRQIAQK